MSWTERDLPDLTARRVVVTGGNSGIGRGTAAALAEHGADVTIACRSVEAGERVARSVRGAVTVRRLDLASLESVRAFAAAWDGPLDVLINNAGVMAPTRRATTAEGHELQFGTNHLGHFVLTGSLLPNLLAAGGGGRVVTVASIAHHGGRADVLDAGAGPGYDARHLYDNSKLANILFADELQRQAAERGLPLVSVAAHPGVSSTGLFKDREGMGGSLVVRTLAPLVMPIVLQSAKAGARPSLFAATVAEPGSYTGPQRFGESRGPIGPARRSSFAADVGLACKLWDVSEQLSGFRFPWP
ncbi:MAG: SDR family NAD(P)-dependent oxidoreductase [Jatrophihabitans sp.]|uniref:SDR family NAD(P)-dependent oxidoreductase n=1 Tax=Jatrophihabitans sp. TaxID=1932789 RepID=UPI003F7F4523